MQKKFIDNLRYITISSNNQIINNNHRNNNSIEKKNEKYFFEYNNVVTLSYEYISNIDNLIEIFSQISNNECFKYPIKFEQQICESGKKHYYSPIMPKWLKSEFTLAELLCSYFEQSILINYEYHLLYNEEISFLYYEELDEQLDNIFKLVEFIGDSNEKKVEIFQSIKHEEIRKLIKENQRILNIIKYKKDRENFLLNSFGKLNCNKSLDTKTIISDVLLDLQRLFISGDLKFVLAISFIKDSYVFSTKDFIIKIVFDVINNYWKSKTAEDLLHDLTTNYNNNSNSNNNIIKKKKRKKNRKNKNEENKDIRMNHQESENDNELIQKDKDKKENINYILNNENIEKKNDNLIDDENNLTDKTEEISTKKTINTENNNENTIESNKEIKKLNNSEDNKINNKETMEKKEDIKEGINEEEEENNNKKKKEKNFFLYPVVQNKKKKNKNKKKEKKTNNNINNDLMTSNQKEKNNNQIKDEDKITIQNDKKLDNEKNNKIQEKQKITNLNFTVKNDNHYKKSKNDFESMAKQKNKFNIGMQLKNINKDNISNSNFIHYNNYMNYQSQNEEIINSKYNDNNGNNGYFNPNTSKSNLSRSKEDDKYFLSSSNFPKFTSFYFNSKKKGRNYRNKNNNDVSPYSFISNNILELSKEIINNTTKVNKNKEILQKIREKYIKKIYEIITIILYNEKLDFLCSFYGSSISGLSIENSDIDIMVKLKKNKNEINYVNKIMNILVDNLKKYNINYITNIHPIYTASVPVIKLECDLSNDEPFSHEINGSLKNSELSYNDITKLFFDITFFEVENEQNKMPSELVLDYIKNNIYKYPQIIDIIYIMKRFLFNRKLNKSYQGGISSYSLFLLTLAFIKYFKNNYDIPIGSLLIEYLNYYCNFDFYCSEIQPSKDNPNEIYSLNEDNSIYHKYNLNIIDPITGVNVAKSTFKIEQIKNAFKEGLDIIISNLYKVNKNDTDSNGGKSKKILDNFLSKINQ